VFEKEFLIKPSRGENQRLDVFLSEKIKRLNRSQLKGLIEDGGVLIDGNSKKPSYRLKKNEFIQIKWEEKAEESVKPEDIALNIVYEDSHIVVLNKEPGQVVHPGAGNRSHTLVNALLFHFPAITKIGLSERPGIVHRLDKETSGVMVTAISRKAYEELKRQFQSREVSKIYTGLVWGRINDEAGRINLPIGRHIRNRKKISVKTNKPREAETRYTVRKVYRDFTLLDISPVTGRTHQIRVHMSASGHPVVGDTKYGRKKTKVRCSRLFLHASKLTFKHPETNKLVEFSAELPQELQDFLMKINKMT
jgi:23S rRNA pseudouridine1911/1915/1917 synthase